MEEQKKRSNTLLFNQPDVQVCVRENEDGEDLIMTAREMYERFSDKTVYMKLCAYDQYKKKRSIWRPCKVGVYIEMDLPDF